jgi:cobalt-zinc-cadmium efflux system outer membrane protein
MRLAMVLALGLIVTPVHGVETSAAKAITLDQVIVNVLEHHPLLGIHDYEARAAAARIRQAQQPTAAELKLDLANMGGTGAYGGVARLEATLSMVKVLESGAKVAARSELAQQQAKLLGNEQDSKRLDLLAKATEQFIHVVLDQYRLRIAQDRFALAQHTHDIVTQRVASGKSHVAEQRRVAIELARAQVELEHAEHELDTSRLTLAANWGQRQADFGSAHAELFALPPIAAFSELEKLLSNNPDLARYATEERLSQAQRQLAQTRQTPNLELTAGIRYLNDSDDAALIFSASLPLGVRTRAQSEIDEALALVQRQPLRQELQYLSLHVSLFSLFQELQHARTAHQVLNERIIPEAQQAAADYEQGYASGRFSLLELNEAQTTLLEAQLERAMTAANYHRLRIEIERLTGVNILSGEMP